jgi:upstream activation factor subunit UAF30
MPETVRKSKRPTKTFRKPKSKSVAAAAEVQHEVLEALEAPPITVDRVAENLPVPSEGVEGVEGVKRKRRGITKEELEAQFDHVLSMLDEELNRTREDKKRDISVHVWRNLIKELKKVKTVSVKNMKKTKVYDKDEERPPSGFEIPVEVSKAMCKFAGWVPGDLHSRVEVTKCLCDYIAKNNLQNPADRRQILADKKLAKLLNYDEKEDARPLTYYYLQKKIQQHFPKKK